MRPHKEYFLIEIGQPDNDRRLPLNVCLLDLYRLGVGFEEIDHIYESNLLVSVTKSCEDQFLKRCNMLGLNVIYAFCDEQIRERSGSDND